MPIAKESCNMPFKHNLEKKKHFNDQFFMFCPPMIFFLS